MKTRIISGVVAAALLIAVLACPWPIVLTVVLAAMAAMAVWELLHNTGKVQDLWLVIGSVVFAAVEVLACYKFWDLRGMDYSNFTYVVALVAVEMLVVFLPLLYAMYTLLFTLRHHATVDVGEASYGFAATLYITAGFASLAMLREQPHGLFCVLLAMLIPWMSDTGAYFVGTFLGKHKMTPVISPKKSWEGFFGGWIISVGLTVLAGVIYGAITNAVVDLPLLGVLAFILAPLSVCGDLIASVIKRQCGIKDYGKIMPGHGGVMDRFDSVVLIAPLFFIVTLFFNVAL